MNDSISRKGVSAWLYNMGHEKLSEYVLDEKRFPSIDRQQGEWVGEADGYADGEFVYDTWYCSNCDYAIDDDEPPAWNFCPMCGTRMSGRKIKGNKKVNSKNAEENMKAYFTTVDTFFSIRYNSYQTPAGITCFPMN